MLNMEYPMGFTCMILEIHAYSMLLVQMDLISFNLGPKGSLDTYIDSKTAYSREYATRLFKTP